MLTKRKFKRLNLAIKLLSNVAPLDFYMVAATTEYFSNQIDIINQQNQLLPQKLRLQTVG